MSVNSTVVSVRSDGPRTAQSAMPWKSIVTHGSSPTTQLSWPGGVSNTSPGPDLELEAVAIFDDPSAAELIAHMVELAALGVGDRAHVLGPAPAGLERLSTERHAADREEVEEALLETAALIRVVEICARRFGPRSRPRL